MGGAAKLMLLLLGALLCNAHLLASTNTVAVPVTLSLQERDWVARHPVMRVGVLTNWAPFTYLGPDGKISGIDVDLLDLISQRTGLKFELIPHANWEQVVSNWNNLDMIPSIAKSPLRETVADFTKEYTSSPLVIVQREGEEVFGTAAVLRRKRLALPRRFIVSQIITNRLPSVPVLFTESQDEAFQMVANKKADATIVNLFVASQYLNSHPDLKLGISGVLVAPQLALRMAVHRDPDHRLAVAVLNKGLASITQHELDEIFARHLLFGLASRRHLALMERRGRQLLTAAAAVAAVLLAWNFFMRKEIRARRKAEANLREANQSMQVFSHSLSHDLRAPLRGITGFAHALKEDYYHTLDDDGRSFLDRIIASSSQMDHMIADVLAYSRTTNSEWPTESVELDPLVHGLIDEFPPDQREYFQIESKLPAVRGHATLLAQCLGNLLSNAIRFVPKDRTPKVTISATEENSDVTVFVEDNGIGIKPADQKRIFQIFERAAPAEYKGTGIGLAVVAKAAERMGGTVGVESQVGQGSRFWIKLRHVEEKESAQQAQPSHQFLTQFKPMRET